jgi:hypothetical protein
VTEDNTRSSTRSVPPHFAESSKAFRAAEATREFAVGRPGGTFPELLIALADALTDLDRRLAIIEKGQVER